MYIVLKLGDFDINNIFFLDRVKNTVMENSNFSRVIYSNETFSLNGIFVSFDIKLYNIEKSFNKYKCLFDIKNHDDIVIKISNIEQHIMNRYKFEKKTPIYRIKDQLTNGFLKIFNEILYKEKNEFILKIYGIWETDTEYGLTYKFISV